MRRKKQLTKRDRKAGRDDVVDTIKILALGMKYMLSVPDGFLVHDVFLPCGDPGSYMAMMSVSRDWQMNALAILTGSGALSFNKDVGDPLCGFTVVRPDIIRDIMDDVMDGSYQKIQTIIHAAMNPPEVLAARKVGANPGEATIEKQKIIEVSYVGKIAITHHGTGKPRPLLGVSNQFTEFVVACMHEAGMPYPVDQHELVAKTGLTAPQLVGVLTDQIGSMDHLYALFRALPGVRDYFGRRPAVNESMRKKWETSGFALHREREGTTREQQAAFIGMTTEDLERLERGEFSPSVDEYERIVRIQEFKDSSLMIGIPTLAGALQAFMIKSKWRQRQLASQARMPVDRVGAVMSGGMPTHGEFKRLSVLIPSLPPWRGPNGFLEARAGTPAPAPAPAPDPVPVPAPVLDLDPLPIVLSETVGPGWSEPVARVLAAHDHPSLSDDERTRVLLAEDALLRLSSDDLHKRIDLFPGESYDPSPHSWQPAFMQKLLGAGVVTRVGERSQTRYRGVRERVDALLGDTDWLLRLVVPAALSRTVPEAAVEGPHEKSSEDVVMPEFPDEPKFGHDGDPSVAAEFLSEAQRLLPDFFKILQYQHEILQYQHDKIGALESTLSSVNSKLDSVLAHLKGGPDDPA